METESATNTPVPYHIKATEARIKVNNEEIYNSQSSPNTRVIT
jgi:hypothetical protein